MELADILVGPDGWSYGGHLFPPRSIVKEVPGDIAALAIEDGRAVYAPSAHGSPLVITFSAPFVALSESGLVFNGPCEYSGVRVREYEGGPQTILVFDGVDDSGTPIDTIVVDGPGRWCWDRSHDGPDRDGTAGRRICDHGCYVTISGGVSRLVEVLVWPD